MRVYEIAREAGVTSADVIAAAAKAGVEARSAISQVEPSEAAALKAAVAAAAKSGDAASRREAKSRRAAERAAEHVAGQKAALEDHRKIARDAADGKAVTLHALPRAKRAGGVQGDRGLGAHSSSPLTPSPLTPSTPNAAIAAAAAIAKPPLRMAPGVKPKPVIPTISAAKTGLTAAGFKPLQHARPAATISISVASAPKPKPPKPASAGDDSRRGDRRGKKDREGQKSFDKRSARVVAPRVMEQGSRISVDEANREISIRGAVVVKDLAAKLNIKPNRLIADLMSLKILASIN